MESRTIAEKYAIETEIARGGMGILYRAVHTELNRRVAIKVLHPQYTGDPKFVTRFQREARSLARLSHDHIIGIFDVTEDNGSYAIVMEYFAGQDLKQILAKRGHFPIGEAVAISTQIASGLAYAHAHGIVHRDIKPGNILVDDDGRVKITDFGIAAAADEGSVTATGQIIGTPEYMSPEQARDEPLDGRSDLYSLGIVLFEMLTGSTPFVGISRKAIIGKLLYEQADYELAFPYGLHPELAGIIRSLVKKHPGDRIPNAATLLKRLEALTRELGLPPTVFQTTWSSALHRGNGAGPTAPLPDRLTGLPSIAVEDRALPRTPPAVRVRAQDQSLPVTALPGLTRSPTPATIRPDSTRTPFTRQRVILMTIGLTSAVLLVAAAVLFMPEPDDPGAPTPLGPMSPPQDPVAASLVGLRELQFAIRTMQNEVAHAQQAADRLNARARAPDAYRQAVGLETDAAQLVLQGATAVSHQQYVEAKTAFTDGLARLREVRDAFTRARDAALVTVAEEDETRAAREKARIARAEASLPPPPPVATPAPPQPDPVSVQPVAVAPSPPAAPRPDIEIVGSKLRELKTAYEQRDLHTLQTLSEMSDARTQSLAILFGEYPTIRVAIREFSIAGETAAATVAVTRLVDTQGQDVTPSDEWRNTRIMLHKHNGAWGKFAW